MTNVRRCRALTGDIHLYFTCVIPDIKIVSCQQIPSKQDPYCLWLDELRERVTEWVILTVKFRGDIYDPM